MLNRYNPLHMFLASYGNELNRIDYRILKESKSSSSPSSFSYNGLVYSFNPDLNMFVNQFGHAMDYAQAVALAASLGYSEQEFEGLADSTDTDGGTDRRSAISVANIEPFVDMWQSPYGWWNQEETWGSQNGLTYMWYSIFLPAGKKGPDKAQLALGNFPPSMSATDTNWSGVGDPVGSYDINWNQAPWNTPTGYINMTFGDTGFILYQDVINTMEMFSWMPPEKRILAPGRHWRAIDGIAGLGATGIANADTVVFSSGVRSGILTPTPWLKRKMNFVRKELNTVYALMGACGFTMGGWECDDEYYNFFDFRSIDNDSGAQNVWLYPNNSSTGNTWWASFTGICAAPDSLIAEGITSMRAFMLSMGYTTGSGWKNVDGMTFRGQCAGITGNIVISGSWSQWQLSEYAAIMKDWVAAHWTDAANDFKLAFGLSADNYPVSNYGYYKTNVGVANFKNPPSLDWAYTGFMNRDMNPNTSDYAKYPTPKGAIDPEVVYYYGFDTHDISGLNSPKTYTREVANTSDIHVYGGAGILQEISNSPRSIDRNLDYSGNSYGQANSGNTFAKRLVANFTMYNAIAAKGESKFLKAWLPANYLGNTWESAGKLVEFVYCAERLGNSAALRFDPTGSSGSTACAPTLCGYDRAPHLPSWYLNPVFNITNLNWNSGVTYGPANHIPSLGKDIVTGLTMGAVTIRRNRSRSGGYTAWSRDDFDNCGYPVPGNTLPAGSIYNQYWTHWYPMAFIALLGDVAWGRQVALVNVYRANAQRAGQLPEVPDSRWNGIQKPMNAWIAIQNWKSDEEYSGESITTSSNLNLANYYYVPTGLTAGTYFTNTVAQGITFLQGEAGPMFYENMRHQYLNKVWKYSYWNPVSYTCTYNTGGPIAPAENQRFPRVTAGVTSFGVCGAIAMDLARKVNDVVHECNTIAGGIVSETMYLAPVNFDEREYLMSGAQLVNGTYLWRVTFAHPATSSVTIQGSVTGQPTTYNVAGVTNFIKNGNNKFGVWWTTNTYELPVVTNPPVPEAQRLGVLNLPINGITYNPLTMLRGATNGGTPTYIT
jgi:hypothetical protein